MSDVAVATEPVVEAPTPAPSIADHAAQFSAEAQQNALVAVAEPVEVEPGTEGMTPEQKAHHSAQQKRDRESGQFKEGKQRHRAESQKASKEDVPRIQRLTVERNAERDRADRLERELAQLRQSSTATPAKIAAAEQRVEAAGGDSSDPEPNADDDKYGGDWEKYLADKTRWLARDEHRQIEARKEQQARERERTEEDRRVGESFAARVKDVREKYEDYDAVALDSKVWWTDGSAIDRFILEDESGPEVLYYLQSKDHAAENDELRGMTPVQQVKRLTLLSQRFSSDSSEQAGTTGAAAGRHQVYSPPKPPTPVRTEAQRGSDEGPNGPTLSIAEHAARYGKSRR